MEHKYVFLTIISNDALKEDFDFGDIPELPEFKLAVTMHENLRRIGTNEDLKKSILIGICEMIVGTFIVHGKMPDDERMMLDIPGDFGKSGNFEADFSEPNSVRIINLFTNCSSVR